jgi:hypothetical protein
MTWPPCLLSLPFLGGQAGRSPWATPRYPFKDISCHDAGQAGQELDLPPTNHPQPAPPACPQGLKR